MFQKLTWVGSYLDVDSLNSGVQNNTDYVQIISQITALAATFFALVVIIAGFHYMASRSNQQKLDRAKAILRNAVIGFILVLGAGVGAGLLKSAHPPDSSEISYEVTAREIQDKENVDPVQRAVSLFLIDSVKSIQGLLGTALNDEVVLIKPITTNTPAMTIWIAVVLLCDILLILAIILQGFKIMGSEVFGHQVDIRAMIPEIIVIFALIHSSVYIIDAVATVINVSMQSLSSFVTQRGEGLGSVMQYLSAPNPDDATIGMAFMYIVMAIVSVLLLFYYMIRNLLLILGAVLSPLVLLSQIIPGLRGMLHEGVKQYLSLMFVTIGHTVLFLVLWAYLQSSENADNQFIRIIIATAGMLIALKVSGGITGLMSAAGAHGAYKSMRDAIVNNTITRSIGNAAKKGSKKGVSAAGRVATSQTKKLANYTGKKASTTVAKVKNTVKNSRQSFGKSNSNLTAKGTNALSNVKNSKNYSAKNPAPISHQLPRGNISLQNNGGVIMDTERGSRRLSKVDKMKMQNEAARHTQSKIHNTKNVADTKMKPSTATVSTPKVSSKQSSRPTVTVSRVPAKKGGKS